MTREELALQKHMQQGRSVVVNNQRHPRLIRWARSQGRLIRIDRPTIWGNPFVLKHERDRLKVIRAYEAWLTQRPDLLARVAELAGGRALACWCAPKACHGHVLQRLATRAAG